MTTPPVQPKPTTTVFHSDKTGLVTANEGGLTITKAGVSITLTPEEAQAVGKDWGRLVKLSLSLAYPPDASFETITTALKSARLPMEVENLIGQRNGSTVFYAAAKAFSIPMEDAKRIAEDAAGNWHTALERLNDATVPF